MNLRRELLNKSKPIAQSDQELSYCRHARWYCEEADEVILIEVADDGRGFHPGSARTGMGLVGMRVRVVGLGGKIELRSRPGEGTKVTVRVPVGVGTPDPPRR